MKTRDLKKKKKMEAGGRVGGYCIFVHSGFTTGFPGPSPSFSLIPTLPIELLWMALPVVYSARSVLHYSRKKKHEI